MNIVLDMNVDHPIERGYYGWVSETVSGGMTHSVYFTHRTRGGTAPTFVWRYPSLNVAQAMFNVHLKNRLFTSDDERDALYQSYETSWNKRHNRTDN